MKLTKTKIEEMANEISKFLIDNDVESGVCIYFNNKRINDGKLEDGEFNPKDYFEYAAEAHILSMSFEGSFYHIINYNGGRILNQFDELLKKYGVYYESGNAWNLTCYPINSDMEVEYTYYGSKLEPIRIYDVFDLSIPKELRLIGITWKTFQDRVGDVGSCVLGAGFEFKYENKEYFLTPCSSYQGSVSWETDKDTIESMLTLIGATDIKYNWGIMD